MSRLTVFLARLIGLSTILIVIAFLVRGSATIDATVADAPVMLVYAIISLAVGVAMILGHNVWSGGALPVVVTLVGWLILAKGLLLLFLTPEALSRFYQQMQYGEHYYFFSHACVRDRALSDLGRIHGADVARVLNLKRHHHQWLRTSI
jgi:hypothetical protein